MAKKFLQKPILASGLGNFVTTVDSSVVTEGMQLLADNTTNDVSITKHGYVPKLPNNTTTFLRGDGTYAAPTATVANAWDGNLDIDLKYMTGGFAQFVVTAGALPTTAATIAIQTAWTGGFPLFLLDNNNA